MAAIKRLIVTADDFGLTPEVNAGIRESCQRGIVTAASLVVNGLATAEAVAMARELPDLEVGLHLSIVEGFSLLGRASSLSDPEAYFDGGTCLVRNWQQFIPRYLQGKVKLTELEAECELQFQRFLEFFPSIPFLNSTQHLHLLPGIQGIVLKLARRYGVPAMRIPWRFAEPQGLRTQRLVAQVLMRGLGAGMVWRSRGLKSPSRFVGFPVSGQLSRSYLQGAIKALRPGVTELMTHPGFDCPFLRSRLEGYQGFDWDGEREALCEKSNFDMLRVEGVELARFRDL
jgi:predicted glycoside hydrolase/deacetylase ChbG (UPF0249 family)